MPRIRSSSNSWRYFNPAYYLKRPKRLALVFFLFVFVSFVVWDRQTLVTEHEVEISSLLAQVNQLRSELEDVKNTKGSVGVKKAIAEDPINMERREKVKEAMLHAWGSYEKYAWGQDELQPQTKNGVNSFGGLGATLIDSLDTLYIMGLDEQFQKAKEWVANSLDFNKDYEASVFETTIRVVGGLLSAYDLSNDKVFLEKAKDIADRLLPAWDTTSGVPYNTINLAHGRPHNPGWTGGESILADSGTEQLEFIALSQRIGDPKYQQKVENVITVLNRTFPDDGLLPIYINPDSGLSSPSTITFGAMGDRSDSIEKSLEETKQQFAEIKRVRESTHQRLDQLIAMVSPVAKQKEDQARGSTARSTSGDVVKVTPDLKTLGIEIDRKLEELSSWMSSQKKTDLATMKEKVVFYSPIEIEKIEHDSTSSLDLLVEVSLRDLRSEAEDREEEMKSDRAGRRDLKCRGMSMEELERLGPPPWTTRNREEDFEDAMEDRVHLKAAMADELNEEMKKTLEETLEKKTLATDALEPGLVTNSFCSVNGRFPKKLGPPPWSNLFPGSSEELNWAQFSLKPTERSGPVVKSAQLLRYLISLQLHFIHHSQRTPQPVQLPPPEPQLRSPSPELPWFVPTTDRACTIAVNFASSELSGRKDAASDDPGDRVSDLLHQPCLLLHEDLNSFYEYLLKVWIQGNRTAAVRPYREMWEISMKGLLSLVRKTTPSSFTYIGEKNSHSFIDKMDELACFAPGMLALGSIDYGSGDKEKFLQLAEELAWTCYNFYQSTPTKLAGENYFFHSGQDMSVGTSWNILRPETVESLFYLWRLTGNQTYQEWGWNIFQAFEKNSRVEAGYVGLKDVNSGVKDNMMQSFFLAETLKYLYLLFSPTSVIPLNEWVFNTEAHPLKIVPRLSNGEQQQHKPIIRRRGRKEGQPRE